MTKKDEVVQVKNRELAQLRQQVSSVCVCVCARVFNYMFR